MSAHLAIVNPAAGGGRCGRQFRVVVERLRSQSVEVEVAETTAPGEATTLAREAYQQGCRNFIAVGGDGTSYEIVNGLFPVASEANGDVPALGFLPLGTGNSFLRDFTEDGAAHSARAIVEDRRRSCDVVRLEHADGVLHFINLLSIGFVAEVNGLRARRFKTWGEAGYIAAVVSEVAALKPQPFPMQVDDGPVDREPMVFASFNNSRFTGGKMMMAPDADTNDGLIDFIRVAPLSRIGLLRTFPKIFSGTHVNHESVTVGKVRSIVFDLSEEIDVMVDGEALRVRPKRMDVLPGALSVRV